MHRLQRQKDQGTAAKQVQLLRLTLDSVMEKVANEESSAQIAVQRIELVFIDLTIDEKGDSLLIRLLVTH
jgi:hypothetical protein